MSKKIIKKDKDKDKDKGREHAKKIMTAPKKKSSPLVRTNKNIKKIEDKPKRDKDKISKQHKGQSHSSEVKATPQTQSTAKKVVKREHVATVALHKKGPLHINKNFKKSQSRPIPKKPIKSSPQTSTSSSSSSLSDKNKHHEKPSVPITKDKQEQKTTKESKTHTTSNKRVSDSLHAPKPEISSNVETSTSSSAHTTTTSSASSAAAAAAANTAVSATAAATAATTASSNVTQEKAETSNTAATPTSHVHQLAKHEVTAEENDSADLAIPKLKGKRGRKKLEKPSPSSSVSSEKNLDSKSTSINNIHAQEQEQLSKKSKHQVTTKEIGDDDLDESGDDLGSNKLNIEDDLDLSDKSVDKLLSSEEKDIKGENQRPKELKELEDKIMEEVESLSEDYNIDEIRAVIREIDFFNHNDSDECLEKYCENLQTTLGYCRQHYIKNWKNIRKKRAILKEGKLQMLIEELITKYPAKYVEAIMHDLSGDKEFYQVLKELNIDTGFQDDDIGDLDLDDDLTVETRNITGVRVNYDDEDVL
ncbi:MAG: hypothetical protein HQK49_01065 [Oligoflexia bacterium]|nr:hypothetical protein [Oligoflexia bacterium]